MAPSATPTIINHINGVDCPALDGTYFDKFAPATGSLLARIANSTSTDVDAAVQAAWTALHQGVWSHTSIAQRSRIIMKLADLVEQHSSELALIQATEQGVPVVGPATMDIPMSVDTLRYFAGWADKLEGRTIPTAGFMGKPTLNYTQLVPVGVCGLIVPWNAPLMITVWKLAPALAAGCTVIIKTSEDAPMTINRLVQLATEAGIPVGVINVVHGTALAGSALVNHPLVRKISFTGSTQVGRTIGQEAAKSFKRVTLELGGKAAQILFADADLDTAIPGLAMGLFVNQGQTCAAGSRILVHRSIIKAVEQRLAAAADAVALGGPDAPPAQPGTQMGALINARHLQRVRNVIKQAQEEGARALTQSTNKPEHGYFLRPAIFTDVTPNMTLAKEEVFGPVGAIIVFDTEEEAISIANDTAYGLSTSLWTRDNGIAHRVAAQLEVGAVAINGWSPLDARLPWGGVKDSGIGRDLSAHALQDYLEEKLVTVVL